MYRPPFVCWIRTVLAFFLECKMNHSFNIHIAQELGLNQAIIIQHLYYWHLRNEGNNKNYIDGRCIYVVWIVEHC